MVIVPTKQLIQSSWFSLIFIEPPTCAFKGFAWIDICNEGISYVSHGPTDLWHRSGNNEFDSCIAYTICRMFTAGAKRY